MQIKLKEKLAAFFLENPGLKTLDLRNCPSLTSLPELPSTLTHLRIIDCPDLVNLPELPSTLHSLMVEICPALIGLPALPSTLNYLRICNCPGLAGNDVMVGKRTIIEIWQQRYKLRSHSVQL